MKPDIYVKRDVEGELRLNPDIDARDIGVAVKDGVVHLVRLCPQLQPEMGSRAHRQARQGRYAKRVKGVTGGQRHRGAAAGVQFTAGR